MCAFGPVPEVSVYTKRFFFKTFPAAQVTEKGLDGLGQGIIAQMDIRQFYNHISPILLAQRVWFRGVKFSISLVKAAVAIQLLPDVSFTLLDVQEVLGLGLKDLSLDLMLRAISLLF